MQFDVIIIGGSFAGLAAALQLGRARRTVLVIDAGERRNRFASAAHGFLGRDGVAPGQIIAEATSQLARYVTVATLKGSASKAGRTEEGFYVETHNDTFRGKRLILAGGVVDVLPDIPGLAERWGSSIFHCPYCHGYELDRGPIGVLATSALSMHHAMICPTGVPPRFGRTTACFPTKRNGQLWPGGRSRWRRGAFGRYSVSARPLNSQAAARLNSPASSRWAGPWEGRSPNNLVAS